MSAGMWSEAVLVGGMTGRIVAALAAASWQQARATHSTMHCCVMVGAPAVIVHFKGGQWVL